MENNISQEIYKIEKKEYCFRVSEICNRRQGNIIPEQIEEALGAITNLYYNSLIHKGGLYLEVMTDYTLTSEYVSHEDIKQIIKYATGVGKKRSEIIQEAIEECFFEKINENLHLNDKILFEPFGTFQLKNDTIDNIELLLIYAHPNAKYYNNFMV